MEECADCGGYDFEWMYWCGKHGLEYCRGCECPACAEDAPDDDLDMDFSGIDEED